MTISVLANSRGIVYVPAAEAARLAPVLDVTDPATSTRVLAADERGVTWEVAYYRLADIVFFAHGDQRVSA